MQPIFKFCKRCDTNSERYADGRCKKCTLARNSLWDLSNRDKRNAVSRNWNARNRDKKLQIAAVYRELNRDKINNRRKEKRIYLPEPERLKAAKRRAQKKAGGGKLSSGILTRLLVLQNGLCACCATPLEGVFHLDHKIPLSRGGSNTDDNVQLLLPVCNLKKYTLTHDEYMQKQKVANSKKL